MFPVTGDGKESQPSTSSTIEITQLCRHFEFPEILLATNNFDESLVIGHGGFGKVYQGNIINGSNTSVAAIKRLDSMSNQGGSEFWAEVEMLSKLRHSHLVSLYGYCNHEKELVLVYEYMPNGTLGDHLHTLGTPLSWVQRLKICIGAARGLDYLHTGTGIDVGVIHRDVKTSNILLHESWAAKISDFGLSKIGKTNLPSTYVSTLVKGTFGYFDPHYYATGKLTRKSDVYAFGVVLFEVLCRKRAVDDSLEDGLATWVQDSIKEGKLKDIIDPDIRDQISKKCLKVFVGIAEKCLHSHPKQRPTMAEVVFSLESALTLREKTNSSLQAGGSRTLFGRVFDMLPFVSSGENSGNGGDSSNSKANGRNADGDDENKDATIPILPLKVFTFSDLEMATGNFRDDLLVDTKAYGSAFLGWVDKNTYSPSTEGLGIAVAVRIIQDYAESQAVVTVLGWLAHPNLVNLLGYCDDKKDEGKWFLVYEYMQKQDLDNLLFGVDVDVPPPLSWGTRLTIMIGVARALAYIHNTSNDQVVHRAVKPSNILVDQNFNVKLGHFEFRIFNNLFPSDDAYVDPDYFLTDFINVKNDIYRFGVLLLETLTGRRVIGEMQRVITLVDWATISLASKGKVKKLMDPCLGKKYPLNGAFECATLAIRCIAMDPMDRPSSEEVLWRLEQIYAIDK